MKKFDIYKIIYNKNNNELIEQINKKFKQNQPISKKQLTSLKIASATATRKKLIESRSQSQANPADYTGYDIVYFAVKNNMVLCKFCHSFYEEFNQMYLDQANTTESLKNKGIGTMAYTKVVEDISKVFNPSTICADAITKSGQRFLEKVGFLPNTNPDSKDSNAILYLDGQKPFLINLADLPKCRNMTLAPNVSLYTTMLAFGKVQQLYNIDEARIIFNMIHNRRTKTYHVQDVLRRSEPLKLQHLPTFDVEDFIIRPSADSLKPLKPILKQPLIEDDDIPQKTTPTHINQTNNLGKK